MYKQLFEQIMRAVFVVLCIVFSYFLVKVSIGYIYPFLIAFILAACLNPLVSFMENNWRMPRGIATISVLSLLFLFITSVLFLLVTEIVQGTAYLVEWLPAYFQSIITFTENLLEEHIFPMYQSLTNYFQSLDPSHQATIQTNLENFLETITESGTNFLHDTLLQIPEIVGFFPGSFTILIVVMLATFMMTNDWHNLTKKLKAVVPDKILHFLIDFQEGTKKAFTGYVKAQLILILITAIMILVGLWFLQVKHALTIAFFAAIADLLPLLGTGIIFIPWIIITFITGSYSMTIALSILYILVIVVRQIIEPKVLSASIGVNPLLSLIILFVVLQLWGIMGIILAPVILILVFVLFQSGLIGNLMGFIKG